MTHKITLFFTIAFLCMSANAQETNVRLNDYWKVGFDYSTRLYLPSNQDNPIGFKYKSAIGHSMGLKTIFYRKNNWQLTTGIYLNLLQVEGEIHNYPEQTGLDQTLYRNFSVSKNSLMVPIGIERIFPSGKNYWKIGLGAELTYHMNNGSDSYQNFSSLLQDSSMGTIKSDAPNLQIGLNAQIGYGIPTDAGLIELYAKAQYGLTNLIQNKVDLNSTFSTNQNANFTNKLNNGYIGLGVTFFPISKK